MATKKKFRYILQYLHTPPELFVFVLFVSTIFRNEGYISMGRTDTSTPDESYLALEMIYDNVIRICWANRSPLAFLHPELQRKSLILLKTPSNTRLIQ